jgi:tagaturonate reductase
MISTPILQFGTSRFLQAHADLFVSEALAAGKAVGKITIVQSSGSADRAGRLAALADEAGYPVQVRGLSEGQVVDYETRVHSVARTLSTQTDWDEIQRIAVEEAQFILSNTSDTGFQPSPSDSELSFVQSMSYPAKLLQLLIARFQAGAGGIQIMPMELIVDNGQALRDRVLEIAEVHPQAGLIDYLKNDVVWVNSLVDRIVSEPIEPAGAVAEPYALWAIENQAKLTLPCEHPSVQVVDSLEVTESLKLFILNLGHTYLVDRWQQAGSQSHEFVRELLEDEDYNKALKSLYETEVIPGFKAAGLQQAAEDYVLATMDRFANPFLDHKLADIAQNHTEKVERRIKAFLTWAASNGDESAKPQLKAIVASQV